MGIRWAAAVVAAAVSVASPVEAQDSVTAFVHVAVIPMDTERVLPDQTVLVRGGRIVAVGPAAAVRIPPGAIQINGEGRFLIPGLGDMHTHLGNEPMADRSDSAARVRVERDLFLYVANGVTTVRNADYGTGGLASLFGVATGAVLQARTRAMAGEIWSPRIYTSGGWRMTSGTISRNLAAYRAAGYDFIKIHNGEQGELLDSLAAAARLAGLPIAGHVEDSVPHALAAGYASIEHLTGYPGGGISPSNANFADTLRIPELVAATRRAGVWNCPTQAMYDRGVGDVPPSDAWPEIRFSRFFKKVKSSAKDTTPAPDKALWISLRRRIIKALQDAGAGLLVGTDAPFLVPGFGVHRELEALVRAGLTPYQALAAGTRNIAAYFGTLDETGTIAVGKRADLVLLRGNPLADIRQTTEPAGVMLGGRWLSREAIDRQLAEYVVRP